MMNLFFKKKVRLEEIENCLKFPKSPQEFIFQTWYWNSFKNTWAKDVKICNEGFEIQANIKVEILKMYEKFWGSSIKIFNSEFYNIWPSV